MTTFEESIRAMYGAGSSMGDVVVGGDMSPGSDDGGFSEIVVVVVFCQPFPFVVIEREPVTIFPGIPAEAESSYVVPEARPVTLITSVMGNGFGEINPVVPPIGISPDTIVAPPNLTVHETDKLPAEKWIGIRDSASMIRA